ncbi:MAG: CpaF family protein, partial [Bryobacterales bacterium]|nr:CpaF family protein [Bryobacterales bacterium]MCC7342746.1 CpaF family protein [Bryobacterales bacterium]
MAAGMPTKLNRANPNEANWVNRLFTASDTLEHQDLKFTLHRKLLERVNLEVLATIDTESAREDLRVILSRLVDEEKTPLSMMEKERVTQEVLDEVFGLGPLEPLLQDRTISDILVTTPYLVVVERNGRLERTGVQFKDNAHLLRIIEKIVSRVGRRVDESSPMVDARLPDGSRVNAIIPPLAVDGPLLSIRRFGRSPLTPEKLVANHSVTTEMMELLKACVRA